MLVHSRAREEKRYDFGLRDFQTFSQAMTHAQHFLNSYDNSTHSSVYKLDSIRRSVFLEPMDPAYLVRSSHISTVEFELAEPTIEVIKKELRTSSTDFLGTVGQHHFCA